MKLTFNLEDIFDLVVDEILGPQQLEEIANELYKDRRGGPMVGLYMNEEFMASLQSQLNKEGM